MKRFCLIFLSCLIVFVAFCGPAYHEKTYNQNAWFMYFGDHKFSKKFGIHLEAQLRRENWGKNPQQLLLRSGFNYHPSSSIFYTVGYCFVETYPYGNFPVKAAYPEHRFWEQMQIKSSLKTVEWISRFRLEQRFSQLPVLSAGIYEPGDAVYTNRFRILNRFSQALSGKSIQDKSIYLSLYDEVMLNFGKNIAANFFDQNRLYLALGYKIPKWGRLELGYLEQTIFKPDGIKIENNRTLQLGLSSTLDFFKSKR
ncbi:MAG: DUF2490 domain-containing protein [Chitinophagaceae bacterium]|nr:DUF2490 domain-containing protein [Chitinophagaceae bacterium]